MKPFNLEEALKGAPVRLKNGAKAYVLADISTLFEHYETEYPLKGFVSSVVNSNAYDCCNHWTKDGLNQLYHFEIIGMWDESALSKLTQDQILEKAYNENLKVTFDTASQDDGYDVVGKLKSGGYFLQHGIVLIKSTNLTGIELYQEKPSTSTVTVTLPRPFKPEIGDYFYYIYSDAYSGRLSISSRKADQDDTATQDGNKFRTLDDAKAWIDAMKGAQDE